ncbi:hypothetical protein B7494_g4173 [Chlorociboria aeruginascens]|nr:hypothetical protein B7494_g4173 [Chlorociboria aeruginascens]
MPPKRRVSAPVERVYKSTVPKKQLKFPDKKKRIRSYGKQRGPKVPKQDNTLTQMAFVTADREIFDKDEEVDSDGGIYEEVEVKRPKKRRRTMGDKEKPDSQTTITQLDWSFWTARKDEEENKENDASIYNVPSSSQFPQPIQHRNATPIMGPPKTPSRKLALEIPSSQSPATPLSVRSQDSLLKRSPFKRRSMNIPISFEKSPRNGANHKLPKLEIEDTFDNAAEFSQIHGILSSPTKRSSLAKNVRFEMPMEDNDNKAITPSRRERHQATTNSALQNQNRKVEILDSDADSDEEEEPLEVELREMVEHEEQLIVKEELQIVDPIEDQENSEPEGELQDADNPENGIYLTAEERLGDRDQADEEIQQETYYGEIGDETQLEAERILESPTLSGKVTATPNFNKEPSEEPQTQILESQRLSTQHVNSMAPRTIDSDIFISIHPQHVANIVNRTKDHEFRAYRLPPTVVRIWIYETKPVMTLKYMAAISSAKRPGEVLNEQGLGSAEFNAKPSDTPHNAYEILALYELADPLSLSELLEKRWFKAAPQKYTKVPPAVLNSLIANLKLRIWGPKTEVDQMSSSLTDTQEVEDQMLSTILQFTQAVAVSEGDSLPEASLPEDDTISLPSSPPVFRKPLPKTEAQSAPQHTQQASSQATTVDLSQPGTPSRRSLPDVIWESPARPVSSSLPRLPITPRSHAFQGSDTPVPFSMRSSQILSKSQLERDGLSLDSVPGPPMFVGDSDEEED